MRWKVLYGRMRGSRLHVRWYSWGMLAIWLGHHFWQIVDAKRNKVWQ